MQQTSLFQYLCGLITDQFNIVLQCSLSYINLIPCSDCAGGARHSYRANGYFNCIQTWAPSRSYGIYGGTLKGYNSAYIFWLSDFFGHLINEMDLKSLSEYLLKNNTKDICRN